MAKQSLLLVLGSIFLLANAQRELEEYNVDLNSLSVSGISSGAAMATQFHVAYSHRVRGCGMVAGVPYWCARNNAIIATATCMENPGNVNVQDLISQANNYASQGRISATSNLLNSRVFIFHGTVDSVVQPGSADNIFQFYANFGANIAQSRTVQAEHGYPTEDYGAPCAERGEYYMNRCNYNGAYEILNHIYGGLQRPSGSIPLRGDYYRFNQGEFFDLNPAASSMDTDAFVYVPSGCVDRGTTCRVHIAYHGCSMGREFMGEVFPQNAGYSEVGELNNIIILYPQAISTVLNGNPYGCWDWWGYLYNYVYYATQGAHQLLGVCRMLEKISGQSMPCP